MARAKKNSSPQKVRRTNKSQPKASSANKSLPTEPPQKVSTAKTSPFNASESLKKVTPSGKQDNSFFEQVYEVVRQIPKGRVTSYGAIAAVLGAKLSARMVGWAMHGASGLTPKVPAHRVVNRNGMLSGKHHFATPSKMQELLEKEGIKVKDDTIVDFKKLFWDPGKEFEL